MSIARHSFFTSLTQILIQFFGILSGIIMARMLGPDGRGVYALYFANAQLIFTFTSLSVNAVLIYFIPAGKYPAEKLLGLTFFVNFLSSIVSVVIILFFYFTPLKNALFSDHYMGFAFVIWLVLYTVSMLFSSTYTSFFQATRRFPQLNRNNLITSVFSLSCFFLFFLLREMMPARVGLFLLVLFASQILSIGLFAFSLHYRLGIRPSFKFSLRKDFKELKTFVLATHLSIIINFFNYRFSTWVINYYLDESALGWYSLAINTGALFTLVSDPLAMVLTPYLSEKKGVDKMTTFNAYFRIFFWVLLFAATLACFLSKWLIPWVYGREFTPTVILFQMAVPGFILISVNKLLASFIISNGKQEYNLYATIAGFVVAVTTNIIFVRTMNEKGAIISNVITYLTIFLSLLFFAIRKYDLKPKNIFFLYLSDLQLLKNGIKRIMTR